ncbi:glycosyltransferase involved in cell wall biosynthesis [Fontibacillus phaseoli]|uniref:Glycosyltransferase involved in cell wall biosynthesis n=1 Tax=Fontibacillus phaseoli TaxID=1416533 RepID=A0A369BET5_9BACL|nr:glycosyltransferase family 4 protein [Fontibacillus phaseoli]RCX19785.1 glycosyltransferase involved in cell wall biosynthesis [Fontibacillus phaseoli]
MNVLFVFYIPSGGVHSLNRQRCLALRRYGVQAECLYYDWGAGLQNLEDFPVYVTRDDDETRHILHSRKYDFVVVTTDHTCFERFRRLGYEGKMILEIQGYGPEKVARTQLMYAEPYVKAYASALLNPNTPHIASLFQEMYPEIPHFQFNNCFDFGKFKYLKQEEVIPGSPIMAWLGRIEDNKNWREYLYIGHALSYFYPNLRLWMFEDINLSNATERKQFIKVVKDLHLDFRLTLRSNVPNENMMAHFSMIGDSGGFLCSTSKMEGAPLAILEAMSCRCPVLATNCDGVSSSVVHNITGKNYNLGDIEHAVREAKELIEHTDLRKNIQAAALLHVQTEFNADVYCRNFIGMLNQIL